ncbi:MAG TPA: hypothetical protein VG435_14050 [Acidimicrobiales bacterium]|nr:hypothetical protein [Acidimicrobiales bacterium]
MVLLLLALVWGALLISWLRNRTSTTFGDSVGSFRRDLNVLQRTSPTTVRPANRLSDGPSRRSPGLLTTSSSPTRASVRTRPMAANTVALRRRQTQKRRRDVFFALLAGALGSLVIALVPGMSIMWSAQVLFDLLLGSYVAVLIRMRNQAAEREMKLRYMPAQRPVPRARVTYDFAAGYGDLELRRAAN